MPHWADVVMGDRPETTARRYLEIPKSLNLGHWVVDRHAHGGAGQRVAVRVDNTTYTYDHLRRLSNRAGHVFRGLGIGRGDRVLLRLGTNLDALAAFLGAVKIGAVPMPTSPLLREAEIRAILRSSAAALAVVRPELAAPIEAVHVEGAWDGVLLFASEHRTGTGFRALMERASDELDPVRTRADEAAFIIYTPDTTGESKGVVHAHRWIIGAGDPVARAMLRLGPDDICFQPQDWSCFHALGCNLLYPLHAGASIVLPREGFDDGEAVKVISDYRVTVICGVPTMYRMILAHHSDAVRRSLASVRCAVSAGGPLPLDVFHAWRDRFGVTIHDALGHTEGHIFVANAVGGKITPGSIGRPLPSYNVAVLNDDGAPQRAGEAGHLVIRDDHPGLALGYYRDPAGWAEVNRNGWHYTKELAYVDEEGDYWYVSRADDLIKSQAYLISPKEVQSILTEHPSVLEAAVVGVPDPVIGQRIQAFVKLKRGMSPSMAIEEALKAHTRRLLAPYKIPHEIEFVASVPKTWTGSLRAVSLSSDNERRNGTASEGRGG